MADDCFTEDTALRFVTGKLTSDERSERQAHLDRCDACQQWIIRLMHALDSSATGTTGTGWWNTVFPRGLLLADRYRIDRFIARGGMGEIYEAFDCLLGMRVAVKTVASTLSDDYEAINQIKAEVQLALRVGHKHVCRIYGLETHQPQTGPAILFLTMELVEGITLGEQIQACGRLEQQDAVHIAEGVLHGLQAAHESNVLHRDLKSDNIMLRAGKDSGFNPVIMDFGLASALNPNSSRLSADHAMVGSLAYMAPEQVQGDDLRVATDLYAFGVILFEMLTGRLPFEASTPAGSALKRLQEPAPHVRELLPSVAAALDEIVARCLEREPKRRFKSADEVLAALRSARLGSSSAGTETPRFTSLTLHSSQRIHLKDVNAQLAPTLGPPTRVSVVPLVQPTLAPLADARQSQEPLSSRRPLARRDRFALWTLSSLLGLTLATLTLVHFRRDTTAGETAIANLSTHAPAAKRPSSTRASAADGLANPGDATLLNVAAIQNAHPLPAANSESVAAPATTLAATAAIVPSALTTAGRAPLVPRAPATLPKAPAARAARKPDCPPELLCPEISDRAPAP